MVPKWCRTGSGSGDHGGDGCGCVGLLAGHDVGVGVEREGYRCVSEAFGDDLDVGACGQEVGGVSVAEVVQPGPRHVDQATSRATALETTSGRQGRPSAMVKTRPGGSASRSP